MYAHTHKIIVFSLLHVYSFSATPLFPLFVSKFFRIAANTALDSIDKILITFGRAYEHTQMRQKEKLLIAWTCQRLVISFISSNLCPRSQRPRNGI